MVWYTCADCRTEWSSKQSKDCPKCSQRYNISIDIRNIQSIEKLQDRVVIHFKPDYSGNLTPTSIVFHRLLTEDIDTAVDRLCIQWERYRQ